MLNSISIIPGSQDEVTGAAPRHELGCYQLGELTPVSQIRSPRTFQMNG